MDNKLDVVDIYYTVTINKQRYMFYWFNQVTHTLNYLKLYILFFIFYRTPCPRSVITVGWWCSNPITEAIGTL